MSEFRNELINQGMLDIDIPRPKPIVSRWAKRLTREFQIKKDGPNYIFAITKWENKVKTPIKVWCHIYFNPTSKHGLREIRKVRHKLMDKIKKIDSRIH